MEVFPFTLPFGTSNLRLHVEVSTENWSDGAKSTEKRLLSHCPLSLPRTAVWIQLLSRGDGGLVVAQGGSLDPGLDGGSIPGSPSSRKCGIM